MNLLEEMVRNLKKDLATPKPKQYGEPPNWNPSNLSILTNKNAVKLGTMANNELANFFASMSTSESKTLYGQPPDSIMNADHIRLAETKQREEQQIKNRNKSAEMKFRNEKIIEFENTNNNIRRSDGSSSNNIRRHNFSNNRGNDVNRRNFPCAASQLKISIPMDEYGNEFIQNCNQKRANGYSEENAKKAMLRFQKRNLFSIVGSPHFRQSRPLPENWGRTVKICEKLVTVPTIADANSVSFVGEGMTEEEAEMNCDLNILEELYNFDVIKEAAIELYSKGRKELIDPARKMDEKLKAWMKSEKIFQKLDKIEANENNFY